MIREKDTIQFEHRYEIRALLDMLEKYAEIYPKEKDNRTFKELYDLLDIMEMLW